MPANVSIIPGMSQQYQAQGNLSDGVTYFLSVVTWSSSNTAVVTIDPVSGLAISKTTGTTTITAVNPYSGFSDSTTLTVDLLSSITVTPATPSMTPGLTHQFTATGTLANGATLDLTSFATWTTSPPDSTIATVENTPGVAGTGIVTAGTTTGTVFIQAIATDQTSTVVGSTMLTVYPVPLASLTFNPASDLNLIIPLTTSNGTTTVPATHHYDVTGIYSGETATHDWTSSAIWSSSNPAVATINANGLVAAVAPGTTTITATDPITGVAATPAATLTVTALSSLAITPVNPSIAANGATQQFAVTGTYFDGTTHDWTKSVIWSSSNSAAATIDANGLATSVAPGTTTITATDPITGIAGSTTLTVTP
jgi:hypothetical protein